MRLDQTSFPYDSDDDLKLLKGISPDKVIESFENIRIKAQNKSKELLLLAKWYRNRTNDNKRAFIIEFAGMPKAGKSSTIKVIRQYFQHGAKKHLEKSREYNIKKYNTIP